ncbi:MAG: hypothetical protein K9W44_00760 [Candidatus Lokiarchaeota archaeon]|nr:hypothetical protein [Candidatus Harpocratesius repetitus]
MIDFRKIIYQYRWGITKEILKEIYNYQLDSFIDVKAAVKITITENEWKIFTRKYSFLSDLDKADQSLLLVAQHEKAVILSDDGELFLESQALKIDCLLIPLFLIQQTKMGMVSKKIGYQCLRFWEKRRSYAKKQIERWKGILSKIN